MPSPTIDSREVARIAGLARLGLSDEELVACAQQLAAILEQFSRLQEIDTKGVLPSEDVTGLVNVWREDTPYETLLCSPQDLLEKAPALKDNHIKVKAVF